MIPGSASPFFLGSSLATATAGGFQIERSLRFNSSDSAYLSRTPAVAGNRRTWTWAGWVKRSKLGVENYALFGVASTFIVRFTDDDGGDGIRFYNASPACNLITSFKFRDASAWYHIVIALDTTQATSTNRLKIYVNGVQFANFSTSSYPAQNDELDWNSTTAHGLGSQSGAGAGPFNGYLANIHFIDGQALTPSSFTETDATTGQLIPKTYTGSYGTNGFNLLFADNSAATASTLGKDTSGNSNNWTPNNLSVTAGAGNDSLVDSPTNYGTDTGVGGEVRGNYCTFNPLAIFGGTNATKSYGNGNLEMTATSSNNIPTAVGTIAATSGKWYAEVTAGHTSNGIGFVNAANLQVVAESSYGLGTPVDGWIRYDNRVFNNSTTLQSGLTTIATNNIVQIALDLDNGKFWFGINNTWDSGNPATGTSPTATFTASSKAWLIGTQFRNDGVSVTTTLNAGQRAFAYTAPSGFKTLCTQNLPAPLVTKSNTVFDVALYTGNGSTQNITGLGFSPDLVWIKARSNTANHALIDAVRGASQQLSSSNTSTEATDANGLTALNSDGFSLGTATAGYSVNTNAYTYAAWAWDAGTSTVSNTAGSIPSQVRANPTAGFSVVTYTGAVNSPSSIGHGLNATPQFVIVKPRTTSDFWVCYHSAFNDLSKYIVLSSTNAVGTAAANYWGTSADWTSSTFGVYPAGGANNNLVGVTTVAYCFTPVVGYSSFGSYTGNGSADGPFVYTGFRPAFLIQKKFSSGLGEWLIFDKQRQNYNTQGPYLSAESSAAENTFSALDFLSNGFKIRTSNPTLNDSSNSNIYIAFAENPFNYARAR